MIELRLLGGLDISGADLSPDMRSRRRHPLALLALVAASPQGLARDRVMAFLWPESDGSRASNSMRQTLFWLRSDLGEDLFLPERASGLQLNASIVASDLWTFRNALQDDALQDAVEAYTGPFMDGFQMPGATEFSQWVDAERSRLARQHVGALDALAQQAEAEGRFDDAVGWRRRQAAADPFSSRPALALLHALVAAGDRTGALEYAAVYENLVRLHLEVAPDPAVTEFVAALRTAPPTAPRVNAARVAPAPATSAIPETVPHATAAEPSARHVPEDASAESRPRWRRTWLTAAVLLIAFAVFAGKSLMGVKTSVADDAIILIGSGMHNVAGRDTATRLVACEGAACPAGDLPQPAYLVARHPLYASPAPGTGFIAHVKEGTTLPSPGYECCTVATFENSFTLPANALTASISVSLLADNQALVTINGVQFGGHTDAFNGENYGGPAATFTASFPPDPSGTNRLRVTLVCKGGAVGLNYRAIITYTVENDTQTAELTLR